MRERRGRLDLLLEAQALLGPTAVARDGVVEARALHVGGPAHAQRVGVAEEAGLDVDVDDRAAGRLAEPKANVPDVAARRGLLGARARRRRPPPDGRLAGVGQVLGRVVRPPVVHERPVAVEVVDQRDLALPVGLEERVGPGRNRGVLEEQHVAPVTGRDPPLVAAVGPAGRSGLPAGLAGDAQPQVDITTLVGPIGRGGVSARFLGRARAFAVLLEHRPAARRGGLEGHDARGQVRQADGEADREQRHADPSAAWDG